MKHNNISNRGCPSILVKVEDFLIQYKNSTLKDKVANAIIGKEKRADIDGRVLLMLQHLYIKTDLTIVLVMDDKNKHNKELIKKIEGVPHKNIIFISKPVQITSMLNTSSYLYYVDDNLERLSLVSHKRGVTLKQFSHLVRGGYTFV